MGAFVIRGRVRPMTLPSTGRGPSELDRNRYHRTETLRLSGYKKPSPVSPWIGYCPSYPMNHRCQPDDR